MSKPLPEIQLLMDTINTLPLDWRRQFGPALKAIDKRNIGRQRVMTIIQGVLTQLRLDMKYLMFDLEATRQERDDYKTQLERK